MSRTFIRQASQIRNTLDYADNVAPAAAMQSGAVSLEDDLNNLRSIASLLRDVQTGNWYDDLAAPVTFESGAKRGVQNVNQDLHDLERKRVLVEVFNINDTSTGVPATGTLTAIANFANTETVTIGTKTYTFLSVLVNVDGNVLIGASASDSLDNLIAAIGLGAGSGTVYAAATTLHPTAFAAPGAGDTLIATAKAGGTAGNAIASTDTAINASWGGATLAGGANTSVMILNTAAKLPANTTAAVGSVQTLGTVAAAHGGSFGAHALTAVSGANAMSPKNIVPIADSTTHDPILSGGRVVWGLLQTESAADGHTITTDGATRAQVSLVRQNGTGEALEAVPWADVSALTLHYSAVQRKTLLALNEQDFLKGSTVDVPSATTVTRQVAYDNQGVTPVNVTTHSYLDLEGPGLKWAVRDDLEAELFTVLEGSAGGTSEVQVKSDVDVLNVDAAVNDFAEGIRVDSGGQRINVGETAGLIESTGANDLRLLGAGEMYLDDGNQAGSSWAQTAGIKLSDTTAEWSAFETAFGEVSLLSAIYQAYSQGNENKTYAVVTTNVAEDVDVSLADGNLDAALPDMSSGNFLNDYDLFVNGQLMRPGANAGANNDYYPTATLSPAAELRFEFKLKTGDVIAVIKKIA